MHKHCHLIKTMMVVITTGYILSVLGLCLVDSKNNDAGILRHMLASNTEEIVAWLNEGDVLVGGPGFRDAADVLQVSTLEKHCYQISCTCTLIYRQ